MTFESVSNWKHRVKVELFDIRQLDMRYVMRAVQPIFGSPEIAKKLCNGNTVSSAYMHPVTELMLKRLWRERIREQ